MTAKLVLRVEWKETVWTRRDPSDTKKFSNLTPELLVEWIVLKVFFFFAVTSSRYYVIIQQTFCKFRLLFLMPSIYFEIFPPTYCVFQYVLTIDIILSETER